VRKKLGGRAACMVNVCLASYERWHTLCLNARMRDMQEANLPDTGFSQRIRYKPQYLLDRVAFPVAGTLFGAVPTIHWTGRLIYRVSKKPTFNLEVALA